MAASDNDQSKRKPSSALWRSQHCGILEIAHERLAAFHVFFNAKVGGERQDFSVKGRLVSLRDYDGIFAVGEHSAIQGKTFPMLPDCEFAFALKHQLENGNFERWGYRGRGTLENAVLLNSDEFSPKLRLHMGPRMAIRQMRKDYRVVWDKSAIAHIGICIVNGIPGSWDHMQTIIRGYYRYRPATPDLLNISAGGACLRVNDDAVRKILTGEAKYMFFVKLKDTVSENKQIYVYLCRKVGLVREVNGYMLRIKYTHEPVGNNVKAMRWVGAEVFGSARLREDIEYYRRTGAKFQKLLTEDV